MNDDLIQTFQLDSSNLRGRILRVGPVLDSLLSRHPYPAPVIRLTGEVACVALMLSSMLKYDGIFTLQIQGDGPVSMVVADITRHGVVRACAKYKANAEIPPVSNSLLLMGRGYLAFTVDQGDDMERYQGIVALDGRNFQEVVQHYFSQSEQITTGVRFAMEQNAAGSWRAGAIMLQQLPEQNIMNLGEAQEDDWRRAMILLQSCTDEELLDPELPQNDLLFRLFHEEGVRVYDPVPVQDQCRCSQERAENILCIMSPEERKDMVVDGKIIVTCEFCNRRYDLDANEMEEKIQNRKQIY